MRLVLDTNVLLAAFISRGLCHDLLELCERDHEMVVSDFLLTEYAKHLKGKFRVPEAKVAEAMALLKGISEHVQVTALPEPVCRDPMMTG